MAECIVLDQSRIRIGEDLVARGAPAFPRPLVWWERNVPLWLDVSLDADGCVVLEPNGRRADGAVFEVTPALRRRRLAAARSWLGDRVHLDLVGAVV
ncbi:hypothetical protein ACIOG4_37610 [Streptomyces microflavus]|uniref:hypothetical protein n=1 Tax=Streptomyces microflavus TaxID=1919 RepID=UPI00382A087A